MSGAWWARDDIGEGPLATVCRWLMIAAFLVIAALTSGCGGGGGSDADSTLPPPQARYDKILVGYFGDSDGQVAETKAHTNVQNVVGWGADSGAYFRHAFEAGAADQKIILAVCWRCGDDNLRYTFSQLRSLNVLSRVIALYPEDEPQMSDAEYRAVVDQVRRVAAEFVELQNVKVAVVYATNMQPAIDAVDWVGMDDYGTILGSAKAIKTKLRPDQRLILVPGGATPWKEDPGPFMAYAQVDPQVVLVWGFIWRLPSGGDPRFPGMVGIVANGMAHTYCMAFGQAVNPLAPPICP